MEMCPVDDVRMGVGEVVVRFNENQPEPTWENITVGDQLGAAEGFVDRTAIEAYCYATGDSVDAYRTGDGEDGLSVPPGLVVNELLKVSRLGYDYSGGASRWVHARAAVRLASPLSAGTRVVITGGHVDKYIRRGRAWRVLRSTARAVDDGRLVAEMDATQGLLGPRSDGPDVGEPPQSWGRALPDVRLEDVDAAAATAETRAWSASAMQNVVFSGFPFHWAMETPQDIEPNIHTSLELARRSGFSDLVMQGMLIASPLFRLVRDRYGLTPLWGSELDLVFIRSVLVGQQLRYYGWDSPTGAPEGVTQLGLAVLNEDHQLSCCGYARLP